MAAKIHPTRPFGDVQPSNYRDLGSSLQRVLRTSVRLGAIPRRPRGLLRNVPDRIRAAHAAITDSRPAGSAATPPTGVPLPLPACPRLSPGRRYGDVEDSHRAKGVLPNNPMAPVRDRVGGYNHAGRRTDPSPDGGADESSDVAGEADGQR